MKDGEQIFKVIFQWGIDKAVSTKKIPRVHSSVRRNGMQDEKLFGFLMRMLHNEIKCIVAKESPNHGHSRPSQLQGGILGYLYHHRDVAVYQKDLEKEFRISRATATNTLQVMEKNGMIVRKSEESDGRLKKIILTPTAEANHMEVEARIRQLDKRMLAGLSEEEVDKLYELLGHVQKNLEAIIAEYSTSAEKNKL